MKNKNLLIGGGIVAILGLIYYLYKNKKPKSSSSNIPVNENVDVTTKGYKKLSEAIQRWQDFFNQNYVQKSADRLTDKKTQGLLSKEATESAYIFATKEILSIESGIASDNSLPSIQKVYLFEMIDNYLNKFLPTYFSNYYSVNAEWYKSKISKMNIVNYYKFADTNDEGL